MLALPSVPSRFAWSLLLIAAAAAGAGGFALGFTLPLIECLTTSILVVALLAVSAFSQSRLNKPAIAEMSALFAYWIAMLAVLLPASYFVAAFNMPLIDGTLAWLDQAIGFDWRWLQDRTGKSDWASAASSWVYHQSSLQLLIAVISLAAMRDLDRLNVCISGLMLATIIVIVLSGLLPAAGAYVHYSVTQSDIGHVADYVLVQGHLKHLWALRDGTLRHLDVIPDGIITFPSYHTAVALICGWATWRIRWIGPLNAVFAGLVILTTLPIGGHHLMDLIGGAAVVAASLKVARAVEQRVPSEAHAVHSPAAGEDWSWIKASSRRKAKMA